ncbi:WD repeat-containing and planar cell polarity effector protein fritz homolog isoform X12 [Ursus arctos]|uniref:WD repeat-containing and planar cell polarity effector protein fritz homolog isoform X12 n=1 Tax=Ursus arctos TaxID=9644 RepID=UPI0025499665|nr:WD repeat-containing and planar cell polarity effector protein fritz homolog isoform X12 [Ursus arctos]
MDKEEVDRDFFCHQMSFCLTELHLWSLKNTLYIGDRDIGIYQYYDKKDPPVSVTEHGNLEEKQKLAESRDYPWTLKNRRPEKLRDSLKELEELMQNSHCVLSKWKNKYVCQLLFGSGVLVSLSLSGPQLEKVVIDRSLVGKLISDSISDALLTDNFIILSFLAQNKLCFIQFTKKMGSPDTNKRLEKLSALDYKISYYEIPGPGNRTTERRLAINSVQDRVACWWPLVSDDAWPWAPISSEKDRANLLLLGHAQGRLELLAEDRSPRETLQFRKFFDISGSLVQMQWIAPQVVSQKPESGDIYDLLFLRFDGGPLGALLFKLGIFTRGQLGLTDIIFQYIHCDEIYEAVNILSSMNWDTLGHQCFISMSAIVNHLLRQKLTPEREAQLEASLGTFYAPTRPLLDTTILEYRDEISKYARRFFHHLLRYQRFEKAFLLAVDIGARDLFMDIHYFALDKGELALAEVARKRASDIDAESITSGVELLGPLDRGDMLNEAFVSLSLAPQGEDTFPDNLPPFCSIHKHIIQQRTLNVSSNRQVLDGRNELEKDTCAESLMTKTCNEEGEMREDCTEQVSSMPNVGLELTTLRARDTCSTN